MLLPTQQTYGLAATTAMQSMLDSIEEQRKRDEEKQTGKEKDPVTEARISASEDAKRAREKIASALFGADKTNATELKIALTERLAQKLGIDMDEARSSYKLGKALEDALKTLDVDEVNKLAEELGLNDLGVSMDTFLAAIKNPYGDDNQRLTDALTKKANGGRIDAEIDRVVQRLEDVADPKTLEELKLGPQGYDPTRVEDAQTRSERQEDIAAAEAGKKLEDVRKVQDVIKDKNEAAVKDPITAGDGTAATDDTAMLAVLAAAAEQISSSGASDTAKASMSDEANAEKESHAGANSTLKDEARTSEVAADAAIEAAGRATLESTSDILPVHVDEIGLYELLKKKQAQ